MDITGGIIVEILIKSYKKRDDFKAKNSSLTKAAVFVYNKARQTE